MAAEDKFQAGEAYGNGRAEAVDLSHDPVEIATDLLKHSVSLRSQVSVSEAANLISDLLHAGVGEPLDDKKGTTELLIGILTSLPATSKSRTLLTNRFIEKLWNNLQHPPQTFVGGEAAFQAVDSPAEPNGRAAAAEETAVEFTVPDTDVVVRQQTAAAAASSDGLYQYRTPDGSCNNVLSPELGKAGSAYARTVRATERLQGVKPDPGLLFDLLMARDDAHFRENPAGISSMFFYHASIIIHDVFRTSPADGSRVETSSYLDLAPLYGSSLRDQLEVRTLRGGKLKPDAFHERRLLGQPVGMSVMLVLYNRFHNHVCDVLLQINEGGRFGLACADDAGPRERALALAKQDHDLFNTARLIVGGLYVNVSLHDYLRAITNTHHSTSDWTLDPRAEMARQAHGPEPAPRGVGNQVSVEFNLLYRFHACISRRDERWLNDFLLRLFPGRRPDELEKLSAADFGEALHAWRAAVPADPAARDIGELKRQPDGSFRDEDLVRVLAESMADPAAAFGARMVPKALRIVEVLGIRQARRWQVASLNEFRAFFGLRRYEAFSEINSDPDVAAALEKLYTDPDMVELYPGLMVEDVKPVRSPGCGICPTYSVGRAILSDAITLVRGDRFNTVDYSVANLTNWGYHEVQPDPKTLGGSVLYRLIQRGLPGWFPFNSVAVMQPFYTPEANERIARELGTMAQFTTDPPRPPPEHVALATAAAIRHVLASPDRFAVPWLPAFNAMFPGGKDLSWFMLAGDEARNRQHRADVAAAVARVPDVRAAARALVARVGAELVDREALAVGADGLCHLDIIRDLAVPLSARLLADLFYLDLRTDENPNGSLGAAELYRHLLNLRIWGLNNTDPAQAWNRRRRAQESVRVIIDSTLRLVRDVARSSRSSGLSISAALSGLLSRGHGLKEGSLRSCGHRLVEELLAQNDSPEHVVDNLWLSAFGGAGIAVNSFHEVLSFFLDPEHADLWAQVQDLAGKDDDDALRAYVVEAQRLTNPQRNVRIATQPDELEGKKIQPGNLVVLMLGEAGRNPADVPDADKFDAHRQPAPVKPFSYGQHACLFEGLALEFLTGLIKLAAGLGELRPAPGPAGQVKRIRVGPEMLYLNDSWSDLAFCISTWKVQFQGRRR